MKNEIENENDIHSSLKRTLKNFSPEIKVKDLLSEATRKTRRSLLAASAISILIVQAGLIPSKISALGIDFQSVNKKPLLFFIVLIIVYFFIAFIIYSISDFIAWRSSLILEKKKILDQDVVGLSAAEQYILDPNRIDPSTKDASRQKVGDTMQGKKMKHFLTSKEEFWDSWSKLASALRAIFEFLLPLLISLYAIISLLLYNNEKYMVLFYDYF